MAVTDFQAEILRLIAKKRIADGATYVAGGLALNHQLHRPRLSADIDIFSDTYEAMVSAADSDCALLKEKGYEVKIVRERVSIVEAVVRHAGNATDIQWVRDSAYRFFPLISDSLLGATLHPFDLATNKILALAGRSVPRDWIDTVSCTEFVQPLGLLAWAAAGKDVGLSPRYILDMSARTRYAQSEIDIAVNTSEPVDVAELSRKWRQQIDDGRSLVSVLPAEQVGKAVLNLDGSLFKGSIENLQVAVATGKVMFHEGSICGAWPQVRGVEGVEE